MKKKIPLAILEMLQPVVDSNLELIRPVKDENAMFHLQDRDENSDFFFKVIRQENSNGKLGYITEHKPRHSENMEVYKVWLQIDQVVVALNKWLMLLEAYNKIHTVYDDPIIKSNQERFEKQFEILDNDADKTSFDLAQQIFLDDYLDNVKSKLLALQEGRPQNEVKELENLAKEALEIQNNLTRETKRQIVKRLSKFWAKAQRVGLDVIKEIFVNVTAELAKRLLIGGQ